MHLKKIHLLLAATSLSFGLLVPSQVFAQNAAASAATDSPAEIVVTGSSLKGVAPVGSSLSTIGHIQIEETAAQSVQQVLKSMPAVTGILAPSQGGLGSSDNSGTNAPTIHGLGASASNSTLILINGHRLPTSGANHVLADPNILPTIALERVEVLADGASSVYGSDAVAGVINFITRKKVNGLEADIQTGSGSSYKTYNGSALFGKTWGNGSFLAAYSYSDRSNLAASARPYSSSLNFTALGGNAANVTNKCGTFALSGTTVTTSNCSPAAWDLLPAETRHTAFAELRQDVSSKLHLLFDFDYSNRTTTQNVSRGSASATMYKAATGTFSANPFFSTLPGASYTLNFDANALFGPGAVSIGKAEDFYGRADATYDLSKSWSLNLGGILGKDTSQILSQGTLNVATFNLAVNGYTSSVVYGNKLVASQTLTAANAFDPFTGQTSASTLASLLDSNTFYTAKHTLKNGYLKLSGDLFEVKGGGMAKLAVGAEILSYSLDQNHSVISDGAASTTSYNIPLLYSRDVQSAYGELYLPIIKNGIVKSLDFILSGRYDHYSDFGDTTNPKIAMNFEPVAGIKFRGNYSKSFVAPALTSIGANASGQTGESGFAYSTGGGVAGGLANVPAATFGLTAANTAGTPFAGVCNFTTGYCNLTSVQGAIISGGQSGLKPQTGSDYSLGVDFTPKSVPGLRISLTYWADSLRNGITAPQGPYATSSSSLSYLLQTFPIAGGATAAQLAAAQGVLPQTSATTPAYFIYNFTQNNVLNLDIAGFDFDMLYRFKTDEGNFTISGSATRKTKFNQFFGSNGTVFSVLGTTGFNTTFPSLIWEGKASLAFDKGPLSLIAGMNYEGGYTYWGGAANPVTKTNGIPTGGGDPVAAFVTFDFHASYTLNKIGALKKANVYVDVTNLMNTAPPFVNTGATNGAVAYDGFAANPLGRVVSVGLRTKF
jgi:iron complex outermembrane recepter protein